MSPSATNTVDETATAMRTEVFDVVGGATSSEVAAIAVALEMLWPENAATNTKPDHDVLKWRFSARPWLANVAGAQRVWTR